MRVRTSHPQEKPSFNHLDDDDDEVPVIQHAETKSAQVKTASRQAPFASVQTDYDDPLLGGLSAEQPPHDLSRDPLLGKADESYSQPQHAEPPHVENLHIRWLHNSMWNLSKSPSLQHPKRNHKS